MRYSIMQAGLAPAHDAFWSSPSNLRSSDEGMPHGTDNPRVAARTLPALLVPVQALANGGVCPRPPVGSEIQPPPDLYSANGKLEVSLDYYTSVDDDGRTLFCFVTADGKLSPTLHVNPGDQLTIHLTNQLPASQLTRSEKDSNDETQCGDATMTDTSVNMHFHGLNVSPKCHSDETIFTLVNSGEHLRLQAQDPEGRTAWTLLVPSACPRHRVSCGAGRRQPA